MVRSRNATTSDQPLSSNNSSEDLAASPKVPFLLRCILCYRRVILFHPSINSYLVTLSFLFSLYSSLQCKFMILDIGFIPINDSVDFIRKEVVALGPLSGEDNEGNCYIYSDEFYSGIIDDDAFYTASRIGTFVSMCAGFMSFIMIWFMFIGNIPNTRRCKSVLQISVFLATVSEAIKFVLFQAKVCTANMWIRPSNEKYSNSTIEVSKDCFIGLGGKLSIACILINLIIMIIFWRAKKYREEYELYRLSQSDINGRRRRGDDTITTATTLQKQASKGTISSNSSEELNKNITRRGKKKKTTKSRNKSEGASIDFTSASKHGDSSSSNESDEDIEKAHFLETNSNSGANYYRKKHRKPPRSKKNKDGGEKNILTNITDDELQGILGEEEKREILQNDWSDSDNEDENDGDWKQRKKDMNIDYF